MEALLNEISEQEYQALEQYRHKYGLAPEGVQTQAFVPIRDVLKTWAESKQTLFNLLGQNLILKQDFEYKATREQLQQHYELYLKHSEFVHNFKRWAAKYPKYEFKLYELVGFCCLEKNKYEYSSFTILNGKKKIAINCGCKPMKTLRKLAETFDIKGFDEFCNQHSLMLNQKGLKGTMTLSIHPLDYWTMSDNDSHWVSCMNWQEEGGYRQGTIEMMNSPNVVIAYLDSSTPFYIDDFKWSNKKWREMFIVDENSIVEIKDYPYHNEDLNLFVLNWLKELAEINMNWKYVNSEPIKYKPETMKIVIDNKMTNFTLVYATNHMYNDFGRRAHHLLYFGETGREFIRNSGLGYLHVPYSGASQCIGCGKTNVNLVDESCVCCTECQEIPVCDQCKERFGDDCKHYVDDLVLCEDCYDNYVIECDCCEEEKFEDNTNEIMIIPKTKNEEELWITNPMILHFCDCCYHGKFHQYLNSETTEAKYFNIPTYNCDSGRHYKCYYIDDLNEEGLKLIPDNIASDYFTMTRDSFLNRYYYKWEKYAGSKIIF